LDVSIFVTGASVGQEYVLEIASSMGCTFGDIGSTENFLLDQNINTHMLQSQPIGDYVCTECGKRYRQYPSLWRHFKFECGKVPQFQCPYCPHRSKQKVSLKKHIHCRHPQSFSSLNQ